MERLLHHRHPARGRSRLSPRRGSPDRSRRQLRRARDRPVGAVRQGLAPRLRPPRDHRLGSGTVGWLHLWSATRRHPGRRPATGPDGLAGVGRAGPRFPLPVGRDLQRQRPARTGRRLRLLRRLAGPGPAPHSARARRSAASPSASPADQSAAPSRCGLPSGTLQADGSPLGVPAPLAIRRLFVQHADSTLHRPYQRRRPLRRPTPRHRTADGMRHALVRPRPDRRAHRPPDLPKLYACPPGTDDPAPPRRARYPARSRCREERSRPPADTRPPSRLLRQDPRRPHRHRQAGLRQLRPPHPDPGRTAPTSGRTQPARDRALPQRRRHAVDPSRRWKPRLRPPS